MALSPGIHLRELERMLGVSFNTIRYHVKSLANSGLISYSDHNGYFRLYPAGTTEAERAVYSFLRSKTAQKILTCLQNNGKGLTSKELCNLTGFAKSTVSEHVRTLLEIRLANKVSISDSFGNFKIQLTDSTFVQRLLDGTKKVKSKVEIVDNFVSLWDF